MDCGDPGTPTDGSRTINSTIVGSVVMYSCNEGFMLEGDENRVCQSNQEWSGELPNCIREFFFFPSSSSYFSLSLSLSLSHTHTHTHSLTHSPSLSSRELTTIGIAVAAVMCPILPDPDNATIFVTGQGVGSQATYICSSGFVVRPGDVIIRNCLPTGEWSGIEPRCIRTFTLILSH